MGVKKRIVTKYITLWGGKTVKKRMSYLEEWEEKKGKKVNEESGERNQRVQIPIIPGEVPGYKCEYEGCELVCKSRAGSQKTDS